MFKTIGITALVLTSTDFGFDVVRAQIAHAAVADTADVDAAAKDEAASMPVTPDRAVVKDEMDFLNAIRRGDRRPWSKPS